MDALLTSLIIPIQKERDDVRAEKMTAYMKNKFTFLGITSPIRKEIFNVWWKDNKTAIKTEFPDVCRILWDRKSREYQYLAIEVLKKLDKILTPDHLPMLESFIVEKSWWDTVDGIAPNGVASIFNRHPEFQNKYITKWRNSENIWLIRSALIFQLKRRYETDEALIFDLVQQHKNTKEFFINKAAGWALRQLAKYKPETVIDFVAENEDLSNLTKREALKHLT